MGMMDDIKDKSKDMMDDPDQKAKVEKIAKEKGMTMDEAKDHLMKHGDKS